MKENLSGAEQELYLAPETNEADVTVDDTAEEIEDISIELEEAPKKNVRVSEVYELRKENRKVYRMSDGTEQAVFYPNAVHVFDDETGEFTEADTTLAIEEDGRHFRSGKGRFTAKFSCEEDNDELFSVEQGMHRITVSAKKNSKQRNKGVKPTLRKSEILGKADILCFENVGAGTDMEYSVTSGGVKENIIVKEKKNVYQYPFILKCENVTAKFDEETKRVAFLSDETGDEIFFIPAPFMQDANGTVSEDVSYEVKTMANGYVKLTVTAANEWINAEERAFPVVIDPQINITEEGILNSFSWINGNMSESKSHSVSGGVNTSENRMYLKFQKPDMPKNPRIKKAELELTLQSKYNYTENICKLGLYKVNADITVGACSPAYDTTIVDYVGIAPEESSVSKVVFDVTSIFDKLNNNEITTANIMIKQIEARDSAGATFYGVGSDYSPNLIVTYESSYGVNTSYRTHTHELGRFGQGSIDLACGNLMFESEDFAWGGNRMPVTIKHLFNSALAGHQYTANDSIKLNTADFSAMKIGNGFKLNVMQSMMYDSSTDEYIFIDESGNEIYFKKSDKYTCCDSNSQCYLLYEDKDGNEMYYDDRNFTITAGETRYLFDDCGRLIQITDKHGSHMDITYTSGKISSVTDGAGREFCFSYSGDFLTAITAPDHDSTDIDEILYSYTNGLLNNIDYPDGRSAEIRYDSNKPSEVIIKDTNGKAVYRVEYTFGGDRVASVSEFGIVGDQDVRGAASSYVYAAASNRTVITTTEPKDEELGETADKITTTVCLFDDDGNCIGEYAYSTDTEKTEVSGGSGINPNSSRMSAVSNVDNLLLNHNFTDLNNWTSEKSNCETTHISNYAYEPYAKFGKKVLRLQTHEKTCTQNGVYQDTLTLPAGEYTLSAYSRIVSAFNGDQTPGAYIRVTKPDGTVLAESEHIFKYSTEYVRLITPFKLKASQSVQLHLIANGAGATYFDGVQLEKNSYANQYNLLTNSNFERELVSWEKIGNSALSSEECFNMSHSLRVNSDLESKNGAKQTVIVKGAKGTRETFTLSGWAKGNSLPQKDREGCEPSEFSLSAVIKYTDGTEETHTASFSPCTDEWQPATVQFSKLEFKSVENLTVCCNYNYNIGTAYFDDIRLFRTGIVTGLAETDFASNEVDEEAVAPQEDVLQFEEATDAFGNELTQTTFQDGEFGTIYRSFEYSSCCNGYDNSGNDLVAETDSRGNRTEYTVNSDTSRNEVITDRLGNKTVYEYDNAGRTTKVTNKTSNDVDLASVSYDYDSFNNLKEITRGDTMQYSLVYNAFHNLESIAVKGDENNEDINLIKYTYKNGNGRLKEIAYANGDKMKATYNGVGQLIAEKWYNSSSDTESMAYYRYVYDSAGNIVRSIDITRQKEYNYTYESGRIIRSAEYNITLDELLNVISKNVVVAIDYVYNEKGMLSKKTISANGSEIVYYTEYPENATPVTKVRVNGRNIESHSKTDSFGRKVFDEIQLGTGFVSRQFSYHAGKVTDEHKQNGKLKSSPTTSLVSQIVLSNGTTLSYAYDAEEHITSVTEMYEVDGVPVVKVTSYTYDALGQLLTETVNGEVVNTMTYDNYGNILTKNGVEYTYDTVWKDKLLAVGNEAISYDAQGNPTEYLGHNLTWEKSRQLKSFDNHTYTYNANGIRTSKTVNGTELHEYVLEGSKILKETWNGNSLIPLYDNSDSVCGIIYNGIGYFFLKNLQGDIIAITNSDGDTVAKYSYDAWGKCTVEFDTTGFIATINPFRYRGYYYDRETDLYYLNSRYYDADTGRFINADSPEYVSTQGGNLFAYGGNCPTKNADYFGFCYTPTYPESYVPNNSGSGGTINYSNSQKTKNRYDFWLAELVEKFIPNVYSNDFCIKERNFGIPGINVKIMLAYAFQTNANAVIGWMLDQNAIEISAFFGITDKVSFAISFGVTWTEMYIKFGIGYSPKKSGVFFSLSLTFSISLWVIAGIAIACAAIPVLGSFLGTAITAVKSSVAVATPVLVPLIPKVANALL